MGNFNKKADPGDPPGVAPAPGPAMRKPRARKSADKNKALMTTGSLGLYKNSDEQFHPTMEPRQQMLTAAANLLHPPTPSDYPDIQGMPLQWPAPTPLPPKAPGSVDAQPDPAQACGDQGSGNVLLQAAGLLDKSGCYPGCYTKKNRGAKGGKQPPVKELKEGITETPFREKRSGIVQQLFSAKPAQPTKPAKKNKTTPISFKIDPNEMRLKATPVAEKRAAGVPGAIPPPPAPLNPTAPKPIPGLPQPGAPKPATPSPAAANPATASTVYHPPQAGLGQALGQAVGNPLLSAGHTLMGAAQQLPGQITQAANTGNNYHITPPPGGWPTMPTSSTPPGQLSNWAKAPLTGAGTNAASQTGLTAQPLSSAHPTPPTATPSWEQKDWQHAYQGQQLPEQQAYQQQSAAYGQQRTAYEDSVIARQRAQQRVDGGDYSYADLQAAQQKPQAPGAAPQAPEQGAMLAHQPGWHPIDINAEDYKKSLNLPNDTPAPANSGGLPSALLTGAQGLMSGAGRAVGALGGAQGLLASAGNAGSTLGNALGGAANKAYSALSTLPGSQGLPQSPQATNQTANAHTGPEKMPSELHSPVGQTANAGQPAEAQPRDFDHRYDRFINDLQGRMDRGEGNRPALQHMVDYYNRMASGGSKKYEDLIAQRHQGALNPADEGFYQRALAYQSGEGSEFNRGDVANQQLGMEKQRLLAEHRSLPRPGNTRQLLAAGRGLQSPQQAMLSAEGRPAQFAPHNYTSPQHAGMNIRQVQPEQPEQPEQPAQVSRMQQVLNRPDLGQPGQTSNMLESAKQI